MRLQSLLRQQSIITQPICLLYAQFTPPCCVCRSISSSTSTSSPLFHDDDEYFIPPAPDPAARPRHYARNYTKTKLVAMRTEGEAKAYKRRGIMRVNPGPQNSSSGSPKKRKNYYYNPDRQITDSDLNSLPVLSPHTRGKHLSATGSTTPSFPQSANEILDITDETAGVPSAGAREGGIARPHSFVPRIPIPAEDLLARQARARALKEWADLDIVLDDIPHISGSSNQPSTAQFSPNISKYLPSPLRPINLSSDFSGTIPRPRDIYPTEFLNTLKKDDDNKNEEEAIIDPPSEKPTRHLQLRNIGTTALASDVYRLIPNKQHIPRWRNEEAAFVAFWGRNPRTLRKEGDFHLIWPEGSRGGLNDVEEEEEEEEGIEYGKIMRKQWKSTGRGSAEKRAEAYRRHFADSVREGDRYPAAINIAENDRGGSSISTSLPNSSITSTSSPRRPQIIYRPHQTLPLPHPHPTPSASYYPTPPLLHGSLLYLNLLTTSRPPCPPGCAVLLSTSSQGGNTPSTGKIPRTREILERLLSENYDLIGSPFSSYPPPTGQHQHEHDGNLDLEEEIPDVSSIGGVRSINILHEYIPDHTHHTPPRKWTTESPSSGANEEKYGVTRFILQERNTSTGKTDNANNTGRKANQSRTIEGAEGKWVVRLASRAEAGRLIRAWNMREFWTGVGGARAERVVMRAEIF